MHIKTYLFKKYNNKCARCGWGELNKYTNNIPLEVEHIDGNYQNNKEENLILLCPNCHSLTETYKGANLNHGRKQRKKKNWLKNWFTSTASPKPSRAAATCLLLRLSSSVTRRAASVTVRVRLPKFRKQLPKPPTKPKRTWFAFRCAKAEPCTMTYRDTSVPEKSF